MRKLRLRLAEYLKVTQLVNEEKRVFTRYLLCARCFRITSINLLTNQSVCMGMWRVWRVIVLLAWRWAQASGQHGSSGTSGRPPPGPPPPPCPAESPTRSEELWAGPFPGSWLLSCERTGCLQKTGPFNGWSSACFPCEAGTDTRRSNGADLCPPGRTAHTGLSCSLKEATRRQQAQGPLRSSTYILGWRAVHRPGGDSRSPTPERKPAGRRR